MWLNTSIIQENIFFTPDIKKKLFDTLNSETTWQSLENSVTNFEILPFDIFSSLDLNLKQNIALGGSLGPEIKIIRKVDSYELEIPLMLMVSYRGNLVFVEDEYLNIWGEGDTIEQAIKSFENFFLYDFKSYMDTPPNRMDLFAQEKLKYYKYLLKIA